MERHGRIRSGDASRRYDSAWRRAVGLLAAVGTSGFGVAVEARADAAPIGGGRIEHCDDAVDRGDFAEVFDCGDELFETSFDAADGVGANVGDGGRFTRAPRADLRGAGRWAAHQPPRATGPNAASCVACHQGAALGGSGDGSGRVELNVIRDPLASADPARFIQRNTPHLFGLGALQRLAEEMTQELRARFDAGVAAACAGSAPVTVGLVAKGVDFGSLRVDCGGVVDPAEVDGVDADLVVRPFQWKGVEASIRSFSRGAEHNELGMQPVELTGADVDGDGDGVANEITIPDMTAMAVYLASQPRPVTEIELDALRLELERRGRRAEAAQLGLPVLSREEVADIARGEARFEEIGCADCHRPELDIGDPVFSEPSPVPGYRDDPFPAGQPALASAFRVDLTRDLPDNRFAIGRRTIALGSFAPTPDGGARVRLYGDLKRHELGPGLAEAIDETGHGASVWLTKELWGVGSSAEYLHDGRATTLAEAILAHGGEALASRAAFAAASERDRARIVRFLENLVLFFPEEVASLRPPPLARRGAGSAATPAPARPAQALDAMVAALRGLGAESARPPTAVELLCRDDGAACGSSADCCEGLACRGGLAGFGTAGRCE